MSEENAKPEASEGLSDAEMAYFQSAGEAEIKEVAPPDTPVEPAGDERQQPDPNEEPQVRDDKGRFVPHGALHAEREEHKKTKAQLEEIARKQAVLEDRWNTLLAGAPKEETPTDDDPAPDPSQDIFAFSAWQKRQVEKLNAKIAEREQSEQQAIQQRQEDQRIVQTWNSAVQEFSSKQADFPAAAQYLSDMRSQQLAALGLDPATVNATIDAELKGVIMQAQQLQRSPAEVIYEYAKVSGYRPQEQQKPAQLPDSLARVAAAQEASRTIAGDGKGSHDPDSPEAIASMSDREFAAWMNDPANQRRFERMMGG